MGLHYEGFFINGHEGFLKRNCLTLKLISCVLLWDSDDIIHDFFYNLRHLNYFRVGPVHLKDVLDVD